MRDYQRQKNNKYIMPSTVYHRTLWLIRDYYRIKEAADNIITDSPTHDGPGGSGISDPTFGKVAKREKHTRATDIIDEEKSKIPAEYRKGVWDSIMYRSPFPGDADRSTYSRWKSRFVYRVAERTGIY